MKPKFPKIDLHKKVAELLAQVPQNKVTTCKYIAEALGDIRATKAVYRIVESCRNKDKICNDVEKIFKEFRTDYPLKKLQKYQSSLRNKVVTKDMIENIEFICGIDVSYFDDKGVCACICMDIESGEVRDEIVTTATINFPYIPTYLAFREFPVIGKSLKRVEVEKSILMIDGNGILHPRGVGIASHIGVYFDVPTIGVTKKLLCGKLVTEPTNVGDYSEIFYDNILVGYALRSSQKRVVYISPGHRISPKTALKLTKRFCRYHIPEPLRLAHLKCTHYKMNKSNT